MRNTILLLIFILVTSCRKENQSLLLNEESIEFHQKNIEYDYSVKKIYRYEDDIHLGQIEFYKNGKLVEQILDEYHTQYFYNNNGQLSKINNCRFNNCKAGFWEHFKYDKNGNLIGSITTSDSIVSMDTVTIKQNRFYDEENRLIKELIRDSDELWKTYTYKNGKVDKEFEIYKNDTILYGNYIYDKKGRLQQVKRHKNGNYLEEFYNYNNNNIVVKKIVKSNKFPLENVKFSANNSTTDFYYNEDNKLIKEIIFDHNDKIYRQIDYKIELKKY